MQRTLTNTLTPTFLFNLEQKRQRFMLRIPLIYIISAIIVGVVTLPVVYLALRAVGAGDAGLEYLMRPRTLNILTNSLLLMGAVVGASVAIGVPFAWLTTRTNLPFRRFWLVIGLLPIVIPSYIGAVTFVEAFGPVGMLQSLLEPFGVVRLPSIYGFFGAWLTITLFTYPYVVLPVRAALLNNDPALEEAARSLGLNRLQVFRRVTLPQLVPAIIGGSLLSALYTLSDFGAVMVMKYNAFTRAIYLSYEVSFNRERAAILAMVLVVFTVLLLMAEMGLARKHPNYRIGTGAKRQAQPVKLGRWMGLALLFCLILVSIGVLLPVGVLLKWALNPNMTSAVNINLQELSANTIGVSAMTAIIVGIAALPLAMMVTRSVTRVGQTLVGISYIGNVLPGIVVALALVYFAANYLPSVYQTIPVLLLGYATRFLPYSLSATRSALTQINPRLEEAARSLGCQPWQVLLRVTVPLARAGILGGMALVFLSVMKELPTTLILAPIGFRTLATRIWTAADSGALSLVGVPALLLLAVSCLSLVVILWRDQHRG